MNITKNPNIPTVARIDWSRVQCLNILPVMAYLIWEIIHTAVSYFSNLYIEVFASSFGARFSSIYILRLPGLPRTRIFIDSNSVLSSFQGLKKRKKRKNSKKKQKKHYCGVSVVCSAASVW